MTGYQIAPPLITSAWENSDETLTLDHFRGRVVMIEVFQMLCPGCVAHGLPQAQKVSNTFSNEEVVVLGLHSVFEHHRSQGQRDVLADFLHENKITFPVGIDMPSQNSHLPMTMTQYQLRGTPSLLLIDRQGRLRKSKFGIEDDLILGAEIMSLLREDVPMRNAEPLSETDTKHRKETVCHDEACAA